MLETETCYTAFDFAFNFNLRRYTKVAAKQARDDDRKGSSGNINGGGGGGGGGGRGMVISPIPTPLIWSFDHTCASFTSVWSCHLTRNGNMVV